MRSEIRCCASKAFLGRKIAVVLVFWILDWVAVSAASGADFGLWLVDRSAIQIALAWDAVPGATGFSVERDTTPTFSTPNRVVYSLTADVTAIGDTGWPLSDSRRFREPSSAGTSPIYHLDAGIGYYYRVSATTAGGTLQSEIAGPYSLEQPLHPDDIVRGAAGDLWADVVLGRPGFGENTWGATDPFHVQSAGGVVVDRNTSHPTHVFIVDGNHNRILGMSHLGYCSITQAPCSIDSDCDGATCQLAPGEVAPQFVLGQAGPTDESACNGDGTAQLFPRRTAPSAATLCLMRPDQISTGETVIAIQPAVDVNHDLYVPDQFNNRILKYRDPFNAANGTDAVAVWGQPDLATGPAELRDTCPGGSSMSELCEPVAVEVDAAGNLWVADMLHRRVLRFPGDAPSGTIAGTADLALALTQLPRSVRVDAENNVYVSTQPHLLRFADPHVGGANVPQTLAFLEADSDFAYFSMVSVDPSTDDRLWVQIRWDTLVRVDVATQVIDKRVRAGLGIGFDVSQAGDLFWTEAASYVDGLYRLGADEEPGFDGRGSVAFLGWGVPSRGSMISPTSVAIVGEQLLVSDRYAVSYWNDFRSVTEGSAVTVLPDGLWGVFPPRSGGEMYVVKGDTSGRIWIRGNYSGLQLYQAPLSDVSQPIRTFEPPAYYESAPGVVLPLPAGSFGQIGSFFPVGTGDRVWVEDVGRSRVLRVVNFDGLVYPGKPPFVDIVLGQDSLAGIACNKGRGAFGFDRDTLCWENAIQVDPEGNLYIQDNATGGMDGGWTRLLRWDAATIPDDPLQTQFGILPDRVYGAAGSYRETVPGSNNHPYPADEPAFPPRAAGFDDLGLMALGGGNPYVGARRGLVYPNVDAQNRPQLALADTVSFPIDSQFDPDGNLYLADFDWNRVIVYKRPFARLRPTAVGATATPSPTRTATATPTATPASQDYQARVLADGAGPYFPLNEVSGSIVLDASAAGVDGTFQASEYVTHLHPGLPPLQQDAATVSFAAGIELPSTVVPPQLSFEGWFKPRAHRNGAALIGRVDAAEAWKSMLWIKQPATNRYTFAFSFNVGGTSHEILSTTAVDLLRTYYVALTLDTTGGRTKATLYVNGVQEGMIDVAGTAATGDHWHLGYAAGNQFSHFVGVLDEIAFYDSILSPTQVAEHYSVGGALPTVVPTPTYVLASTWTPTVTATRTVTPTRTATSSVPTATRTATPQGWVPSTYRDAVLVDGAGPYYRLNENSGTIAYDASSLGRDGTYDTSGTLLYAQSSLVPSDADAAVSVSDAGVLVPATTSPMAETLEGWFEATADVAARALIVRVDSDGNWRRMLWISGTWPALNRFAYSFLVGSTQYDLVGTTTVVSGATHHVVVTLERTGVSTIVRLFVDGEQEATQTVGGAPSDEDHWQIGLEGGGGLRDFVGIMDEIALYDTALSPTQVRAHFELGLSGAIPSPTVTPTPTPTATATLTPIPTSTVTALSYADIVSEHGASPYYRLNEASGAVAFDVSDASIDAAYEGTGSVFYSQPSLLQTVADSAVKLVNSGVLVPATTSPVDETIEAWVKPTTSVDARALIVRVDSEGAWQRMLWITGPWPALNRFAYSFILGGTQYNVVGTSTAVAGTTYHVAVRRQWTNGSTEVQLFVNGVQEAALTRPGTLPAAEHWQIGKEGGGGLRDFEGVVDEVAFYDTALSENQILQHFDLGTAQPTPTTVPTATVTHSPTATPSLTATATRTATATQTPTITATATPTALCRSGVALLRAKARISNNLAPDGDEKLSLRGEVSLPDGSSSIDPIADGAQVAILANDGRLLRLIEVPPGAAPDRNAGGWQVNSRGTKWTFRDRSGSLAPGVGKVVLQHKANIAAGYYKFLLAGKDGAFSVDAAGSPYRFDVVLGPGSRCASAVFEGEDGEGPTCRVRSSGDSISCD